MELNALNLSLGEQQPMLSISLSSEASVPQHHEAVLEKPKKAKTGYNLFFQAQRQEMLKETNTGSRGRVGFADMARTVAKKWKAVSDAERSFYETLAKADKERYDREMEIYERYAPPDKQRKTRLGKPKTDRQQQSASFVQEQSSLILPLLQKISQTDASSSPSFVGLCPNDDLLRKKEEEHQSTLSISPSQSTYYGSHFCSFETTIKNVDHATDPAVRGNSGTPTAEAGGGSSSWQLSSAATATAAKSPPRRGPEEQGGNNDSQQLLVSELTRWLEHQDVFTSHCSYENHFKLVSRASPMFEDEDHQHQIPMPKAINKQDPIMASSTTLAAGVAAEATAPAPTVVVVGGHGGAPPDYGSLKEIMGSECTDLFISLFNSSY